MHHASDDLSIADYAIIGDGRTAALVGRNGSIDWLCYGRFDGSAVFCRILDRRRGGFFRLSPTTRHEVSRSYVDQTNVLETRFRTEAGEARLTDCMPLHDGPSAILRRIDGLSGHVDLRLDFYPTFDFARVDTQLEPAEYGCVARGGQQVLRLTAPSEVRLDGNRATGTVRVAAGETRWVTLTHDQDGFGGDTEQALASCITQWRVWSAKGRYDGEYEAQVRRSALVLKLMIHAPTGGVIAAPTTSLPECPGGVRNWDYRFVWLRDASWVVSALMHLGYHEESMAFIAWVQRTCVKDETPSVFYDLDGQPPVEEIQLRHLSGYRGSSPVRIGNAAAGQAQHDVYGEVASAIHLCWSGMPSMRPLQPELWQLLRRLAEHAADVWRVPDHGLWEVRTQPRHFVMSKAVCWMALQRALDIAETDNLDGPREHWRQQSEQIMADLFDHGFDDETGTFRRAFGEPEADAALLLLPRYGLIGADDPRFVRTLEKIRTGLGTNGLLRRYVGGDGLAGDEGAFTACSFWLADALARIGRIDEARQALERAVSYANDVGLLAEEIETGTGELLGNFPQAFTHLALIRAATTIAEVSKQRVR